jgi:uncharacterized membrane protein
MTAIKRINNSAGRRLLISLIIGAIVSAVAFALNIGNIALLLGYDAAALVFVVWVWLIVWPMNGDRTAKFALREDPSRAASEIILILASIASLVAVGYALVASANTHGVNHGLLAITGVGSVVISWALVHTLYALQYAMLYYSTKVAGGVNFKNDETPSFSDFAYLAFTVGMTFQIADTDLIGNKFRRTVLKHALLAYLFGTVIVATTINFIAGLGK